MVVIASHIAGISIRDRAGSVAEAVRMGFALAILCPGALDLVGRRSGAPQESFRETGLGHLLVSLRAGILPLPENAARSP